MTSENAPQRPTDGEVKQAVRDELAGSPGIDPTHIGIAVTDGVVTTSGQVASYPEKLRAERAVHRVHGVRGVAEGMTVAGRFEKITDTQIALEVADAIDRAIDVPKESVQFDVHGGVVTLTGAVSTHAERESAARAVSFLRGVHDVQNELRVQPDVDIVDIRGGIVRALLCSAVVDGDRCVVTADEHGVVTLTGTVESWTQRRRAETLAWASHGVTAVTNHLHVLG